MGNSNLVEFVKKYDYSFFGIGAAIFFVGVINLYSATHAESSLEIANLYRLQLIWFMIAFSVGALVSFINPKNFFRVAYFVYVVNIVLLILVLLFGHTGMGAQRWIGFGPVKVQPSEFMKVGIVFALARFYSRFYPEKEVGFKELIVPIILAFIPAVLVMVQPDLGTGMLIVFIFFLLSFYHRLKWKTIMIIAIVGVIGGGVMYKYGLKEYQRKRIITFIDPTADAKGSGYNAIQSKIAIGSGQFFGKGFKKSSQASLNYLPENHTDFVFAVFNEEHGFFGSLVLITLYALLFFRFVWLATAVDRLFDSLLVMGLMSIFFWHAVINMSMVTGLLPIVGIPLPLMSYGGSSLLTFGICCGIATSISNSRNLF